MMDAELTNLWQKKSWSGAAKRKYIQQAGFPDGHPL
jgi:hypothetical protein